MSQLLLERLAAGQPVRHADLQAWAAGALRQIAHGADAAAALRLDRAQRVRHRDRHLHTAWLLLAPSLTAGSALAAALVVVGATLVLWRTSIHLLWVLAAGAVVGGMGWV